MRGDGEMIDRYGNKNQYRKWAIATHTVGSVKEIVNDEKSTVR